MATPAPTSTALPATRLARGMVARTVPAATPLAATAVLRTSPLAPRTAATPGAKKRGCAEAVSRQTARVQANKPWTSVCLQNMKSFWKAQICLRKRKDEYL